MIWGIILNSTSRADLSTISMSLNVVKSGTLLHHFLSLNNKGVNIGSTRAIEAPEFPK